MKHFTLVTAVLVMLLAGVTACGTAGSSGDYGSVPDLSSYDSGTASGDASGGGSPESQARVCKAGLDFKARKTTAVQLAARMPKGAKPVFSTTSDGRPLWIYAFDDGSRLKVIFVVQDVKGGGQELRVLGVRVREPSGSGRPSSPGVSDEVAVDSGDLSSPEDGSSSSAESEARACADDLGLTPNVTTGDDILEGLPSGVVADDATVGGDGEYVDWTYAFDDGSRLILTLAPVEYEGGGESAYLVLVDYLVEY